MTHFFTYYNIVERHREAMLWSFFMLKLDEDGDGLVSSQELLSALSHMGLTQEQIATAFPASTSDAAQPQRDLKASVRLAKRTTLAHDSANAALVKAGWPVPLKSRYEFSSQDGYPLGDISDQVIYRRGEPKMERRTTVFPTDFASSNRGKSAYYGWPDFVDDPAARPTEQWHNRRFERQACQLDLDGCLVRPLSALQKAGKLGWDDIFKQFAYLDVGCGDCSFTTLWARAANAA